MDNAVNTPVAGISRRSRWAKRILKPLLSIIIVALVLKYQVNRPRNPLVYWTSNPNDTTRDGINYTCGCSLPPILQARMQIAENPTDKSNVTFNSTAGSTNVNVCQDRSSTETVNVLMYPNSTRVEDQTQVGILDDMLQDAYGTDFTTTREIRNVSGFVRVKRIHDISWHNNTFLQPLSKIYLTKVPKQRQLKVPIDYLNNTKINTPYPVPYPQSWDGRPFTWTPFLDFPTSYINLAFAFNCTDCSRCPLQKVNQIFRDISGDSDFVWGSCDYWWNTDGLADGNPCSASQNWYTAKCVMYPTEALPLNYAIDDFLQELIKLLNVSGAENPAENIFTPEDLADKTGTESLEPNQKAMASFSANVLHMEFSKMVESDSIQLNFFKLEKYSGAWLTILNSFPTLDSECSELKPLEVFEGTAICNMFTDARNQSLDRKCIPMTNESVCEEYYIRTNDTSVKVTVDADDDTLWSDFNVTPNHYQDLMCINKEVGKVPMYKVLWMMAESMQNNSLNRFLESKKWTKDRDRASGVCINSYPDVSPQNFVERDRNTTIFMETKCHDAGYCWLTGRYQRITDIPGDDWHKITPELSNPDDLFVCYIYQDQSFWIWLLITCGILFGWLGTLDLVCEWIIFPISRYIHGLIWHKINKLLDKSEGKTVTDPSVPSGSGEIQRVVVMRSVYRESFSDTAAILGRWKPVVELEAYPALARAAGGLGNTTEKAI